MSIRLLSGRILLAGLALTGGAVLAMACNDDGEALTLEEYFERVEELDGAHVERQDEIEGQFDALGEDADVDQAADLFEDQLEATREFHSDLEDIDAPDEVEEAHDRAVEALGAALETFDTFVERFREADTIEEAFGQFEDSDFEDLDRADEACRDLVQIATDNNIEVTIDCESDD